MLGFLVRETILKSLAAKAATDRAFLSGLRKDPRGTLAAHGFDLTGEELALVLDLRRRVAGLGDGMVAALITGGLQDRFSGTPGRPRAPGASIKAPSRPGRPGGSGKRRRNT